MCPTPERLPHATLDPRTNPAARIVRTAFALRYTLQARFKQADLDATPAEWALLNLLTIEDDKRVGDIADLTKHDRTTITRVLDGLARKGRVARARDPEDRRAVRIRLTTAGRRLHGALAPIAAGVLDAALAGISASALKALFATLTRIHENLLALED